MNPLDELDAPEMPRISRTIAITALATVAAVAAGVALRRYVRSMRRISLSGKTVLITGGSRGLGLELARQAGAAGARIAICARDAGELEAARADLESRGIGGVVASVCDITKPEQVADFVNLVRQRFGPIDVLINNAGIIMVGPFEAHDRGDFEQAFATHVNAPLEFIRAVLPDMKQRKFGRIINISSIGGKQPVPHMSAYISSKHALVGLSEALRSELQRHGIFVTLVCPGVIRTGSAYHAKFKGDPEREYAWFAGIDNMPGIAIPTERLARQILDATMHGDAELITPTNAWLSSLAFSSASGIGAEVLGLIGRFFPRDVGVRRAVPGWEADVGQLPGPLQEEQQRNAARFNENH